MLDKEVQAAAHITPASARAAPGTHQFFPQPAQGLHLVTPCAQHTRELLHEDVVLAPPVRNTKQCIFSTLLLKSACVLKMPRQDLNDNTPAQTASVLGLSHRPAHIPHLAGQGLWL